VLHNDSWKLKWEACYSLVLGTLDGSMVFLGPAIKLWILPEVCSFLTWWFYWSLQLNCGDFLKPETFSGRSLGCSLWLSRWAKLMSHACWWRCGRYGKHIEKLSTRTCFRADVHCLLRGDDLAASCVIERKPGPAKTCRKPP
jgi:hypothetical protein